MHNLNSLFCILIIIFSSCSKEKTLAREECFPKESGKIDPLAGAIKCNRYYSPNNIFSCNADDFGAGSFIAQDLMTKDFAAVSFYSPYASFDKIEMFNIPPIKDRVLDKKDLKDHFNTFAISILETVDNAKGIQILRDEVIETEDGVCYFVALSVDKMSVLRDGDMNYLKSSRVYLAFQNREKLCLITTQIPTMFNELHNPESKIEALKTRAFDFKKSLIFYPINENWGF